MAPVRRRRAAAIVCACALLGSASAAAEEPDLAALRSKVDALEQQLHEVQAQLRRLEGSAPAAIPAPQATPLAPAVAPQAAPLPPAPAAASASGGGYVSPEAALKQRWSSIKPAMADARVADLLGQPSTKFKLDGRDVWYYYYPGTGGGSVFFTDEAKVSSSQSPFGWGW
jgi:hypothetical protein